MLGKNVHLCLVLALGEFAQPVETHVILQLIRKRLGDARFIPPYLPLWKTLVSAILLLLLILTYTLLVTFVLLR